MSTVTYIHFDNKYFFICYKSSTDLISKYIFMYNNDFLDIKVKNSFTFLKMLKLLSH